VSLRHAALAAVVAAASAAAGADDGVQTQATVHFRSTVTRNIPDALVLYDPGRATFDEESYLRPDGSDRYGSVFASLRAEGRLLHGDLRWVLAADTGELRRTSFPKVVDVKLVTAACSSTGLTTGTCRFPRLETLGTVSLESTALASPTVTANGRTFREEVRKTLLLREAYAAWSFGRAGFATVRAGRKRMAIADGLVHDDYSTGVELELDLGAIGPRWDLSFGVYQPTRDFPSTVAGISPVAIVRADFLPSLFERAGFFAAGMRDRSGSIAELVRSSVVESAVANLSRAFGTAGTEEATAGHLLAVALSAPLESDASIGWLGTSGSLVPLRGQHLGWTLALEAGTLHRLTSTGPGGTNVWDEDVPLRGKLASLRWESDLGDRVTAGAFLLYLSGGTPPARGPKGNQLPGRDSSYDAFLGISPFVTTTNLFFGGGLSDTFAARQVSAPGVNGRGVVAPGVSLSVDPLPKVSLQGKAAWLRSDVTGPFGGKIYGTEADLDVTWAPVPWLLFGLEVDVLWPGDFYPARDTVYKTVLAVDLVTP
jgi:hypothetical protein